jgi:uncharacterized membrane protein
VLKKRDESQSLLASDLTSFRRQESIFIALNLLILAVLFSLHCYFNAFWGKPSLWLMSAVAIAAIMKVAEWLGIRRLSEPLKPRALATLTWASIALNFALACGLAVLTDREDTPYFVLMVVAVMEAAFRLGVLRGRNLLAVVCDRRHAGVVAGARSAPAGGASGKQRA